MADSRGYLRAERNSYLRYISRLLANKYHVNVSSLADAIGVSKNYHRNFLLGARDLTEERLDTLEEYVFDLYGGLLAYEVPQDDESLDIFIRNLSKNPDYMLKERTD